MFNETFYIVNTIMICNLQLFCLIIADD